MKGDQEKREERMGLPSIKERHVTERRNSGERAWRGARDEEDVEGVLRKINISIREVQSSEPFIYVGPCEESPQQPISSSLPLPARSTLAGPRPRVYLTVADLDERAAKSVYRERK